jgi:hypothetical protein
MQPMYYIGPDVHKQKISYCVKDSSGKIYAEGWIPATRLITGNLGTGAHFTDCLNQALSSGSWPEWKGDASGQPAPLFLHRQLTSCTRNRKHSNHPTGSNLPVRLLRLQLDRVR